VSESGDVSAKVRLEPDISQVVNPHGEVHVSAAPLMVMTTGWPDGNPGSVCQVIWKLSVYVNVAVPAAENVREQVEHVYSSFAPMATVGCTLTVWVVSPPNGPSVITPELSLSCLTWSELSRYIVVYPPWSPLVATVIE
jgi:hypothetical protein